MIKIPIGKNMTYYIPEKQDDDMERLTRSDDPFIRDYALQEFYGYDVESDSIGYNEYYDYKDVESVSNYIDSSISTYDDIDTEEEYPGDFEDRYGITKQEYYNYKDF